VLVADTDADRGGDAPGAGAPWPSDPPSIAPTVRAFAGARRPDRSRWVSSAGLRIAVYEWGDPGDPVLLAAHGGFDFAGTFDVLAPLLAAGGWRVVSWDARGHGDSEKPVLYSWAADLRDAAAVLDSCARPAGGAPRGGRVPGEDRVAVLGHSKGGGIVLEMAHALPHRLSHLINLDGLPSRRPWPDLVDHDRTRLLRENVEAWLGHRRAAAEGERRPGTLAELARRRRRMNPRLPVEWLEYLVTIGARQDADGSDRWRWKIDPMLHLGGFGPWRPEWSMQRLPGIGVPVLGVLGLELEQMGWGTTPEDVYPHLPPGAEFHPLEGVGHFVHVEQPALIAELVLDFLRRRRHG
jgi:pimeloyl-ACP methyl ester carboxylesterase